MAPQERQKEQEALRTILDSLPLNRCELKQHQVTGEWGWHAPKGKIFRMTGRFIAWCNYSPNDCTYPRPEESLAKLIAEHPEDWEAAIREAGGINKETKVLFEDNVSWGENYAMPEVFKGKWLVVKPNFDGQEIYDIERNVREPVDETRPITPELYVKDELYPYYDRQYFGIIDDIPIRAGKPVPFTFDSPVIEVHWRQEYAQADLDFCRVRLVNYTEPEEDLKIHVPRPIDQKIGVVKDKTQNIVPFVQNYIKAVSGATASEEEALDYMRYQREIGVPFDGDPLKGFEFLVNPFAHVLLPESAKTRENLRNLRIAITSETDVSEVVKEFQERGF